MPNETECPHCGAVLRQRDGTVPRTAIAALMGLSLVAACEEVTVYGPGPTGGFGGDGGSTTSSSSGQAGMGGKGGAGGSAGQAGMGGAGGSGGK